MLALIFHQWGKARHWYFVRVTIKNKKPKEEKKSRSRQEEQDVITRDSPFDIQIRPVYTSRQKIYAHVRVYAPDVIKGVNDGRGKSHNPLLFADLSVFRDASSGALSSPGAMNKRWRNKRWKLWETLDAVLSPFTLSPICSLAYTHTHTKYIYTTHAIVIQRKKMYRTLAT